MNFLIEISYIFCCVQAHSKKEELTNSRKQNIDYSRQLTFDKHRKIKVCKMLGSPRLVCSLDRVHCRIGKEICTDVDKIGFSLLIGHGIWQFYILYL